MGRGWIGKSEGDLQFDICGNGGTNGFHAEVEVLRLFGIPGADPFLIAGSYTAGMEKFKKVGTEEGFADPGVSAGDKECIHGPIFSGLQPVRKDYSCQQELKFF
jgi:hypothetical protein